MAAMSETESQPFFILSHKSFEDFLLTIANTNNHEVILEQVKDQFKVLETSQLHRNLTSYSLQASPSANRGECPDFRFLEGLANIGWIPETSTNFHDDKDFLPMTLFRRHLNVASKRRYGLIRFQNEEVLIWIPKQESRRNFAQSFKKKLAEFLCNVDITDDNETDQNMTLIQLKPLAISFRNAQDKLEFLGKILEILYWKGFHLEPDMSALLNISRWDNLIISIDKHYEKKSVHIAFVTPFNEIVRAHGPRKDSIKGILSHEMSKWTKSELLWSQKSRQGKRHMMMLFQKLSESGWFVLNSFMNASTDENSIFTLIKFADFRPDPVSTPNWMTISVASSKKIACDFPEQSFYTKNSIGDKRLPGHISEVLASMNQESEGVFNQYERVFRYPEDSFRKASISNMIFANILAGLFPLGWNVYASANISGSWSGSMASLSKKSQPRPDSLFLVKNVNLSWKFNKIQSAAPTSQRSRDHGRRRDRNSVMNSNADRPSAPFPNPDDDLLPSYEEAMRQK